jgi:threonine synthase
MDRPETFSRVANDQAAVETFIRERARITRGA